MTSFLSRFRCFTPLLFSITLFLPGVTLAEPVLVDRVVAVVGGEVITLSELRERCAQRPKIAPNDMLDMLISEKLIEIGSRRRGVEVSDSEVEAAVERHIAEVGVSKDEFEELLKKEGLTMDEYRAKVRADLRKIKFVRAYIRSEVEVSDEEVLNYYRRHPDKFRAQEEVHLARIFLPFPMEADAQERARVRKLAEKIRAQVLQGADFSSLAKKYSSFNPREGGDLGWVDLEKIIPKFKEAVETLDTGDVSKVVELSNGCNLLYVKERKAAGLVPFEDVEKKIRDYLFARKIAEQLDKVVSDLKQEIPVERLL